jgi:hypothetical protein
MKDLIKKKVLSKNWTFSEISNLAETVDKLSVDIYSEMSLVERYKLVYDLRIKEDYVGMHFEDLLKKTAMTVLSGEVAQTIRELLQGATISFGGNNNEISERSMGGESHKERPADEKKSSLSEE